jgi:hypothetical protein
MEPVQSWLNITVKSLTGESVTVVVPDIYHIFELKSSVSTRLACPPELMRLIFEATELHKLRTLRDYCIGDGAVILLLRRSQLHRIGTALHRLLLVTREMQEAVIAQEEYEESFDNVADFPRFLPDSSSPLLVSDRRVVRFPRCRACLYRWIFG